MTLNRLICPRSEHAMPEWIRRTALADILKADFAALREDALHRNLDRLHPNREQIECELAAREQTLFDLDDSVYLYDLTSTYFEGHARANPQAKRGYSRDKRPDCKQVVVGLVLDRDGFRKAHEVFDGNLQDRRSVDQMLNAPEKRVGKKAGATVIVDRGMAYGLLLCISAPRWFLNNGRVAGAGRRSLSLLEVSGRKVSRLLLECNEMKRGRATSVRTMPSRAEGHRTGQPTTRLNET